MLVLFAGIMVVVSPAALLAVLGLATLSRTPLSERSVSRYAQASSISGLIAALCILTYMLTMDIRNVPLDFGDWVSLNNVAAESAHAPPHVEMQPPGALESTDDAYRAISFSAEVCL